MGSQKSNLESNLENNNDGNDSLANTQTGSEYILFLILILLLIGNQDTFKGHFELLDKQTSELMELLDTFSATAEGLKSAIATPQEMLS